MEAHQFNPNESNMLQEGEISLFDLVIVLLRRKRLVAAVTSGMAVLALIACLIVTPLYQGVGQILPRQDSSVSSGLLTMLGAAGALAGIAGLPSTNSSDLYVGLLKSYKVLDRVIDQFNLIEIYGNDRFLGKWRRYTREEAREDLTDHATIESDSTSGIVTVAILDEDPAKSAEMTNGFVTELLQLTRHLDVIEAGRRKGFFEGELKATHEALTRAEEELQKFQETTGALQIDEQARAVMTGIATLEARIAATEIQLKVMNTYATSNNPDVKKLKEELSALREERNKLEEKERSYFDPSITFIPTGKIPPLGIEYLRKQRQLKYQQTLWEVLVKQYEVARLDESRISSAIQVVTEAVVPEKKAKPKTLIILVAVTMLGLVLAVVAAFILEAVQRASNNPANAEKVTDFKKHIF